MTPQQLLGLGIRFSSIWLVLMSAQFFMVNVAAFGYIQAPVPAGWTALALLPALLGVVLWVFPMSIAHKLLPQRPIVAELDAVRDVTAAFAVTVGFFAFLNGFPHVYSGIVVVNADVGFNWDTYFTSQLGASFAPGIVQSAAGLLLILVPRAICAMIFRSRHGVAYSASH